LGSPGLPVIVMMTGCFQSLQHNRSKALLTNLYPDSMSASDCLVLVMMAELHKQDQ